MPGASRTNPKEPYAMKKTLLVALAALLMLFAAGCSDDDTAAAGTSYIVAFDTMGGSWIFPQLVAEGATASEPSPAPTRAGYTFDGWYQDQACLTPWNFGFNSIYANTTIYAKWTGGGGGGDNYVFFDTLGGSGIGTQVVATGGLATEPVQYPDKSGYIFTGWYKDETCTTPWNFSVDTVTTQTIIYAKWTVTPLSWTTNSGIVISACLSTFTNSNHINIPNYINGHPVIAIGTSAFEACEFLTSITFPPFLHTIGTSAFAGSGLTSVTIPECVREISIWAFADCTELASVTLPAGLTNIRALAFNNCSALTSIDIPATVTSIDVNAFESTGLTSIVLPDSITKISSRAFRYCANLATVTLPTNLKSIGIEAFRNCTSLSSLSVPSGVTNIMLSAFSGCTGLGTLNMYPTTAPTLGTEPFLNVSGCILNVPSGASGYGVNPWSDAGIFSAVNYSL